VKPGAASPAPAVDVAALQAEMGQLEARCATAETSLAAYKAAQQDLGKANAARLSLVRTDVEAIAKALAAKCLPVALMAVADAALALNDAPVNESRLGQWCDLLSAYLQGQQDKVDALSQSLSGKIVTATDTIHGLEQQLSKATTDLDAAEAARVQALADAASAAAKVADQVNSAVANERAKLLAQTRAEQVSFANTVGKVGALATAAFLILGYWLKNVRPFAAAAALVAIAGFSLARFLGTIYADVIAWAVCACLLAGLVWYLIRNARDSNAASKVKTFLEFGAKIVPALDRVYEDKTKVSDWLKARPDASMSDFIEVEVYDRVGDGSEKMSNEAKALVHQIRAYAKTGQI